MPQCVAAISHRTPWAYDDPPEDFKALLPSKAGPKTLSALALVAELVYARRPRRATPRASPSRMAARTGPPYTVDRGTYDRTIETLNAA